MMFNGKNYFYKCNLYQETKVTLGYINEIRLFAIGAVMNRTGPANWVDLILSQLTVA